MIKQATVYSVTFSSQLPGKKARVITDHIYANSKGEAKSKALKMARTAAFISTNNEEAAMATKIEILDIF